MLDLHSTSHAEARVRQRGFREADVDLVLRVTTRVANDAFFLTDKDAAREIELRRREIQQLERLRGSKLIVEGGTLITFFHADAKPTRSTGRKRGRQS